MLHRSFKPAKCKTALNLAKSRIKLLKNRKEAQVKQMRRELAQLLQSGQDQTARIRVEHVVREEKMMVAYELIEIYCELLVARMPIIESQKNCPLDLKEAITSLIFAAKRCGDIPELEDVSKNFTAKYGKEFATAAMELRPQCGVCRTLVEKLSVKAPDPQTKLKILHAIAEEHNVKWEGFDYEDPVPSVETPVTPLGDRVNHIQMESLDFLIPNNPQQHPHGNLRSDSSSRLHAHPNSNIDESPQAATSQPATVPERTSQDLNQSSETAQSSFPMGRPNWKEEHMEAIAAAQSAAKSAERANAAARAAAEFAKSAEHTNVDPSGGVAQAAHDQNDTKSGSHYESKRENGREVDNDSDSEAEYNVFASSYDQELEEKSADSAAVFDEARSEDGYEFIFAPEENPYDLFSPAKSSQRQPSFHQQHSLESWSDRPSSSHLDELQASESVRMSPNYFNLHEPTPIASHRAFSGNDEEPRNKKTNPEDIHFPKINSENDNYKRWDEDATSSKPSPRMGKSSNKKTNPLRWDDEDATSYRSSPQMGESSNKKTNPLRWDEEDATSSSSSPRTGESSECQCLHTPKGVPDQGASNSSKPVSSGNNDISRTPRHVHPKLPDFEALTAHMKSLRTNSR